MYPSPWHPVHKVKLSVTFSLYFCPTISKCFLWPSPLSAPLLSGYLLLRAMILLFPLDGDPLALAASLLNNPFSTLLFRWTLLASASQGRVSLCHRGFTYAETSLNEPVEGPAF